MTTHDIEAMTAELVRAHHVIADLTAERDRLHAALVSIRAGCPDAISVAEKVLRGRLA